jgi:hypothetical protein
MDAIVLEREEKKGSGGSRMGERRGREDVEEKIG